MDKRFVKIAMIVLVSTLTIISCQNVEPNSSEQVDNQIPINGKVKVQINLLGTSFDASVGAHGLSDSKPQTIVQKIAGNTLIAELNPSISPFSDIIKGDNLQNGFLYRVFVFDQEDKTLVDFKDFKVGEEKPASFTLDFNGNYIFIAYTDNSGKFPEFDIDTDIKLDDINVDFSAFDVMYFKLENYSPAKIGSTVNITLMHKTSTITLDIRQILYKDYVKDVSITPNYMSGVLNLNTGNIIERKESTEYKINDKYLIYNAPEGIVFGKMPVNITDTLMFKVKIKQNNEFNEIKLPFKLDPGTKYTLSLKMKYNCGAFVSKELWKQFMCHNLGANYDAHPINRITDLYGNKYQWGIKEPASTHEEEVKDVPKTIVPASPKIDAWQDDFKTENDPCPNGYRIPTKSDFEGIIKYNKIELLKTWNEKQNYLMKFGEDLILPFAGYRNDYNNYKTVDVNIRTWYWSSHAVQEDLYECLRIDDRGIATLIKDLKRYSFPVRCIKEGDNTIVRPDIPNIGTGWDKDKNIEVDIKDIIKENKKKNKGKK